MNCNCHECRNLEAPLWLWGLVAFLGGAFVTVLRWAW
jgi:hypothetical protein